MFSNSKFLVLLQLTTLLPLLFATDTIDQLQIDDRSEDARPSPELAIDFTHYLFGKFRPEHHTLAKHVVSIRYAKQDRENGGVHICGGTIINKDIILTAAHCLYNFNSKRYWHVSDLIIIVGNTKRLGNLQKSNKFYVKRYARHSKFCPLRVPVKYDIAVIQLSHEIEESESAQPISLPKSEPDNTSFQYCTALGWGILYDDGPSPNEVVYTSLSLMLKTECKAIFDVIARTSILYNKTLFRKGMLCTLNAYNPDVSACKGDSGGPLICDNQVFGIVSWGMGCHSQLPAVFTDVWYFRKDLDALIAKSNHVKFNRLLPLFILVCICWLV